MSERPALLLAGHGTRHPAGAEEFDALADRVREFAPDLDVAAGFLELTPPTIPDAIAELARSGARAIVVVPLMLLAARHAKDDIPALLTQERRSYPQLPITYGRDLGPHPHLLATVEDRIGAVLSRDERDDWTVLVVGRGSSDPDANAELHKIARLLWEGRGFAGVEACFVGITGPRVPDGLERCRRLGAHRILVVPYFLFTGVLEERIRAQADAFARRHPGIEVRTAGYLGPDDRVARLVLERYAEALRGDARMNCDLCIHRVALPGFAHEVGAPATPHFHPDDPHTHPHEHAPPRLPVRSQPRQHP